jgi:hypothetical protein
VASALSRLAGPESQAGRATTLALTAVAGTVRDHVVQVRRLDRYVR